MTSYNSRTGQYHKLNPTTKKRSNAFREIAQIAVQPSDSQWATTTLYYNDEGLNSAKIDAEGYYAPFLKFKGIIIGAKMETLEFYFQE